MFRFPRQHSGLLTASRGTECRFTLFVSPFSPSLAYCSCSLPFLRVRSRKAMCRARDRWPCFTPALFGFPPTEFFPRSLNSFLFESKVFCLSTFRTHYVLFPVRPSVPLKTPLGCGPRDSATCSVDGYVPISLCYPHPPKVFDSPRVRPAGYHWASDRTFHRPEFFTSSPGTPLSSPLPTTGRLPEGRFFFDLYV